MPSSFFAKAKSEYNNWTLAWFREALQNSLDAGALKIDFTIIDHPSDEGAFTVVCHDNGKGMDYDTLTNCFLSMGGSKKDLGNIGGFGYAKVLLAFAHKRYSIKTNNILLEGESGDYVIKDSDQVSGVRLEVDMTKDDCRRIDMERALHQIVHHSKFKEGVKVTLNGEVLLSANSDDENSYKQVTSLGPMSFKDMQNGQSRSSLWVRMNGLAMFNKVLWMNSGTAFDGYLELEGSSLDVLTSNRDGLSRDNDYILNQMMQELANDREKLKLSGDIDLTLNRISTAQMVSEGLQSKIEKTAVSNNMSSDELLETINRLADAGGMDSSPSPFAGLVSQVIKERSKVDERINKIPKEWYPENFRIKHSSNEISADPAHKAASDILSSMEKKRNGKLALAWDRMIKTLLNCDQYRNELCIEMQESGQFSYYGSKIQTGFVFGKPAGMMVNESKAGVVAILLNPDLAQSEDYTFEDLIDIAHHELAHVNCSHHNEDMVMKMEQLRRICRRHIGERTLAQVVEKASHDWRMIHNNTVAKKPIQLAQEATLNPF